MRFAGLKRVADVVIASVVLFVTLPVLLVALVGSAITLRAWPLFVHDRIGLDGKTFRCVKIRTLSLDTPRYLGKRHLLVGEIPRFTRLLRLLHVDELPQLALVLTGRMSLVGPRPEMPFLYEQLDPSFASVRSRVRPGCTGLWQVGAHCHQMIGEHPEYDRFYVRNRTLRLDLWILLRTFRKMLPVSNRLVTIDEVPRWAIAGSPAAAGAAIERPIDLARLDSQVVDA